MRITSFLNPKPVWASLVLVNHADFVIFQLILIPYSDITEHEELLSTSFDTIHVSIMRIAHF